MENDWSQEKPGLDRRALGALKLEAAARRRRRLRNRVLTGAATVFIAAWSTLFAQSYLKGSASASTPAPTTTSATPDAAATQSSDDGYGYYSYGGGAGSGATSQPVTPQTTAPAPVTTSQS
jgi:hypothetical protein